MKASDIPRGFQIEKRRGAHQAFYHQTACFSAKKQSICEFVKTAGLASNSARLADRIGEIFGHLDA